MGKGRVTSEGLYNWNGKKALQALLSCSSADQNTFCIDCFLKPPKVIVIINQLISVTKLRRGFISGGGALIWDYDKKPFKQLLTYSRADLTRFCIYCFLLSLENVIL